MRRELSVAGLSLALYAGALLLGASLVCSTGEAGGGRGGGHTEAAAASSHFDGPSNASHDTF
jgi:hypothetical protein